MDVLAYLIPISLTLGVAGLVFFVFTVRTNQYDDPEGDAQRILNTDYDDRPKPREPKTDPAKDAAKDTAPR